MIPLVLTTGFLGSGKTTFLRGVAERERTRHLAFLVNEFSSLDVDGDLVEEVAEDVVRVPGGSIFCRCVVRDFIDQMKAVPERFADIDGLVVEASGIADPGVVGKLLADTGLDSLYELAGVISLVDPGTLPKLLQTLPNMQSQIRTADLVLVNKCDEFGEDEIRTAEALVRELNPDAELRRTTYAAYDGDILALRKAGHPEGDYAACRDPNYARFEIGTGGIQDPEALQRAVTGLGNLLYRLKGVTHTPGGDVRIDAVGGRISSTPVRNYRGHVGLAAICTGGARSIVERKLRACEMARNS
jgi:G3E family GTPase